MGGGNQASVGRRSDWRGLRTKIVDERVEIDDLESFDLERRPGEIQAIAAGREEVGHDQPVRRHVVDRASVGQPNVNDPASRRAIRIEADLGAGWT